ncbi:amidohydrolase family protein [Paenibacillus sp. strain BS8-2]
MIIDVHAHLGYDHVFDEDFTLEEQLDKHHQFDISRTILQPASCHDLERVVIQHNVIAEVCKTYPGKFFGMANPNPHLPEIVYERELRRCVEELGFIGVKIHTFAHAVNPNGAAGNRVLGLARKLNIPVMVHTGAGIPFANPSNLIETAERYPDVQIVMAHCGMMIMAGETIAAMRRHDNLTADITWTAGFNLKHWSDEVGADRFMFGTDHADNAGTEIAKVRTCGLTVEQQEDVFNGTARRIYFS